LAYLEGQAEPIRVEGRVELD